MFHHQTPYRKMTRTHLYWFGLGGVASAGVCTSTQETVPVDPPGEVEMFMEPESRWCKTLSAEWACKFGSGVEVGFPGPAVRVKQTQLSYTGLQYRRGAAAAAGIRAVEYPGWCKMQSA